MSIGPVIDYFKNYFPLNVQECSELERVSEERKIKRRQFILQEGDVCRHYSFVISGCFRMYVLDDKGMEHNIQLVAENDWISDLSSFYSEKPSRMYIEAMEPAVIIQLKKTDLLYLFINYHKFDRNFRILTERKYMELQDRVLQNISTNANGRYLQFLETYPDLANRIPNIQIASYLGITPEFLSKIRKDIASGK